MNGWPVFFLLLVPLGLLAWRAFRNPRGVYLRSVAGVLLVALGWAGFWWLMSPANEAGFGFFAIWVVLIALASATALAACLGATARHVFDALGPRPS
jgi:hypothetical protein